MQDKIIAKKLQKEEERIKNLLAGIDSKPVKGVPKGGLLEKKLKEKQANVKLVTDMVAGQRKAEAAKKKEAKKKTGVMGKKIAKKVAEKKKKAEVADVVAKVKAKKAKKAAAAAAAPAPAPAPAPAAPAGKFNALTFLKKNPKVKITFVGTKGGKNSELFKKYKPAKNFEEFVKLAKAAGDATPNGHINYDFKQGYLYIHSDGVKNIAKLPTAGSRTAAAAAPKN